MLRATLRSGLWSSVVVCATQLAHPTPAYAQSVADVLRFLVTNQSVQTGSVTRDDAAASAASGTISQALLASLSTIPVTTSSGAFIYRLNPSLGTVERATRSFGPFFVERALPAGHLQPSIGVSFQHFRYDALDGHNLRNGTLITTANTLRGETAPFDTDRLALDIDTNVATLYANLGLLERFEIGVAVPMVNLSLEGTRTNIYRGTTFTQAVAESHALGLADVVVRGKYALFLRGASGIAAAADVRLPTGRAEDLLGTGTTSVRASGIASLDRGAFALHGNGGWTFGGLAHEFTYGAAISIAPSARVSVTGELLGRWIDSPGQLETVSAPHPLIADVETLRIAAADSGRHVVAVSPGVKWNINGKLVFMATVSTALSNDGLTSGLTPFFGFDYAVGR
jgi:hypothetical protein